MPAASSKPSSQNLETEVQDPVKLLIGALEKKTRNLEKRKTKLEGYKEMVDGGKSLNKDQEEAVSHYQEVQGNLNFAKEFLVTIQTVVNDTSKAKKKLEKKENLQRQEQELQRIQNILLLQNVLNQMGQEHIRNDFLSGSNGAELLVEADLTFLDEFYPLVSPSREDEEPEEETEIPEKEKSFDEKMADAAVHLDKFLKEDEGQVCGTTYKYLKEIVNRIHKCGYLDNIPEPPSQEVDPPAVPEVQDKLEEPVNAEEDEEISASSMNPSHPIESSEVTGFNQSGQTDVLPVKSQVIDIPNPPEPIEMPPPKPCHAHDVNDVLAPVEGGVTFLQESMLELDPSHVDPAVVAVSLMPSQSYMSTAFQSTADSSSMDRQGTPSSQIDQSVDSLRQSAQADSIYPSQPDSVYTQNIYESQQTLMGNTSQASMTASTGGAQHDFTSQQNLQTQQNMGGPQGIVTQQGYIDQSNFASQASLNSGPVGLANNQSSLSSVPTQGDYGSTQQDFGSSQQQDYNNSQQDYTNSHQSLSGGRQSSGAGPVDNTQNVGYNSPANQNLSDLRDYRNSPIDPQLTKAEERQTSSSPGVYQPGSLQPSQFTASEIPSKDGYGTGQLKTDAAQPQSIPFPNEAQSSQSLTKEVLEEPTLPKSTMNAAAPPFQSSARASPQMPQTLHTPEDSNFSSSPMQAASDASHSAAGKKSEESRSVEYRSSPPNIDNNYQYQSYPNNNYARNNRGNRGGRGGGAMGSPGGYRNARGGAGTSLPFMRNSPRFNNSNIQRGGYSQGYMPSPRESFQQRAPEMGYTQTAYNTFNRPQEPAYYRGRGGINRGAPRGGRGGNNIRGQMQYRGRGGGGYPKSGTPITA